MPHSTSLVSRFRVRELGKTLAAVNPSAPSTTARTIPNPFLPRQFQGKWNSPKYSLRRQADLVKEAKRNGSVHLLPFGPKNPDPAQAKELVTKHAPSPILQAWLQARNKAAAQETKELEQVDPSGVEWTSKEPTNASKTTYGLYGKRRAMFKGRKWEKEAQLRKEYMEKVVDGMVKQKANMRWGRARKSKKPRSKYPI